MMIFTKCHSSVAMSQDDILRGELQLGFHPPIFAENIYLPPNGNC